MFLHLGLCWLDSSVRKVGRQSDHHINMGDCNVMRVVFARES
jgi:hypothetical protein